MKLVKNIDISDDSVLTSSSIAEPDLLTGEVEWSNINRSALIDAGLTTSALWAMVDGGNGYIYASDNTDIYKIEPLTGDLTHLYLVDNYISQMILASSGLIYALVDGVEVLTIDPDDDSVDSIGAITGDYISALEATEGFVDCIPFTGGSGTDGTIMRIDVINDTISYYTNMFDYSNSGYTSAVSSGGLIYATGNEGNVLKVDTESQTLTTFDLPFQSLTKGLCIGDNGYAYCFPFVSKYIIKIDLVNETSSYFTFSAPFYSTANATLLSDGMIYSMSQFNSLAYVTRLDTDDDSTITYVIGSDQFRVGGAISYGDYLYSSTTEVSSGADVNLFVLDGLFREGEQAISTSTHKIYQALSTNSDDPEIGAELSTPTWVEVSATNKYKAFDDVVGTQSSSSTGQIVYEVTPGVNIDSVTGINITGGTSVTVTMTDPTEGEVYTNTINLLDNSNVIDAYSYWFGDIEYLPVFTMLDLPYYKDAVTTVTIDGTSSLAIGGLLLGPSVSLGTTLYDTNTQLLDFSVYTEDDFGNIEVTKRPSANLVNFEVSVESKDELDYVYKQLKSVVGEFALYIGEEENAKEMTTAFGLHRNVTLTKESPTLNKYTLQVRSLI